MIAHDDRAAWLAWRREEHRIGASEVAAVLGLSPWREPWQVWAERCAPHLAAPERGAELDDGLAWEPVALAAYRETRIPAFSRRTSAWLRLVAGGYASHVHPDYPWLHATPDACVLEIGPGRLVGLVEIKTDRTPGAAEAWPADGTEIGDLAVDTPPEAYPVPVAYWLQAQTQLACTGAEWCDLYVWIPRYAGMPESRVVRVLPHPAFRGVLRAVAEWRDVHLVGGEPPPVAPDDCPGRVALARWRYPDPAGRREATGDEADLMRRIVALREREREAERERAACAASLRESMAGVRSVWTAGVTATISTNGALSVRQP